MKREAFSKGTAILATLGPATGTAEQIRRLAQAGVDAFRVNFSHGDSEQRESFLASIREVERDLQRPIAAVADLCGPEIRVGPIEDGEVVLETGQELVIQRDPIAGTQTRISTTLAEIVDAVQPGESILLADGRIALKVVEVEPPNELRCRVVIGGPLSSGKGVNLPSTRLDLSPLTEKDRQDLGWIAQRNFDFVALSFVQRAGDIEELRTLLDRYAFDAHIIAKIEKPQALDDIGNIIRAADAIMLARGDLGVEMDFPAVPVAQKRVAYESLRAGKTFIVATEMLESMVHWPRPTRAEVSDIANAVFDYTDAVMLSAETSIGQYPVEAVIAMARTVEAAEAAMQDRHPSTRVVANGKLCRGAVAAALTTLTERETMAAAFIVTNTGSTARLISRNRPSCPVIALCDNPKVARRANLYFGVRPLFVQIPQGEGALLDLCIRTALETGLAGSGDRIVVVAAFGAQKTTNGVVVHTLD